jgi:hypothetical protein
MGTTPTRALPASVIRRTSGGDGAATVTICQDQEMARGFRKFRPTPWALTIAAWDIWRRLPPQQRRQLMTLARKHGPKLAAKAAKSARRRP